MGIRFDDIDAINAAISEDYGDWSLAASWRLDASRAAALRLAGRLAPASPVS